MKLCRAILILAVLASFGVIALLCVKTQWGLTLTILTFFAMAAKKGYQNLSAFGTARWAHATDLERKGMLSGRSGLIVGRIEIHRPAFLRSLRELFDKHVPASAACQHFVFSMRRLQPTQAPALVRLTHAVHVAVFAPTGAGKGVSCVIPFLLDCPDSCVVVDFKGDNALLTAAHRREKFGHRTVILDPYKIVTQEPDTFNPMDEIHADSTLAIDDCRDLAESLVIRTGQEKDPHWSDSAELWIGAIAAVVTQYGDAGNRSLQTLRTLLTDPTKMEAVIKMMCGSDACGGMLARLGNQLTYFKEKELASVLTTTNRFLRFLDTLAIADSTKTSSFDPKELRNGRMTIYLVLPPEHMRAQSALLRMWIGSMLRAVVRGGLQDKNKTHFILDEAASLGAMSSLDDAVDKYRGYGVRLQFYYQSLGQLKKCWPDGQDQTLLSNTSTVFFACNDHDTAEHVSNRLGEATIIVDSGGTSSGTSKQTSEGKPSYTTSHNSNRNWAQQARKLLKPEEVVGLPKNIALTFTPGIPPLCTTLIKYYEEKHLTGESRWKRLKTRAEVWLAAILLLAVVSATVMWITNL